MAEDSSSYGIVHQVLLQAFIARSSLTYAEARPILAAIQSAARNDDRLIPPEDITEPDFNGYVRAINAQISPLDYEIRTSYKQTSPFAKVFAFVNTTSDPLTQLATAHTPDEIAYIKRILDDMFEKYNTTQREIMAITDIQATNLRIVRRSSVAPDSAATGPESRGVASNAQSLTGQQAEKLLSSLVEEGWFEKDREFYTLSPRALIELRGWLTESYNDAEEDGEGVEKIKLCKACGEIVTIGQRCPTRSCKCRLHDHCTRNFFRMQREERCPFCKSDWTGHNFVGPRAGR